MVTFDAVHPADRYRPMAQDPHPRLGQYRVTDASAIVGTASWLVVVGLWVLGDVRTTAVGLFLVLGLLAVTPLALGLVATRRRSGGRSVPYRLAVLGQPPAALLVLAIVAFQPSAPVRNLLLLPWVGVGLAAAAFGGWRLGSRGPLPLPELAIDAALAALPVGGVALLLGGGPPVAGAGTALDLAAVHVHFAGVVLPLVVGHAGRIATDGTGRYPRTPGGAVAAATTVVLLLAVPLLAVAAVDGVAGLAAVVLLSLGAVALALVLLTSVVPVVPPRPAVLLAVTALSLGVTMAVVPVAATTVLVDAGAMVAWHGTLGGVGVALPGLVAFRLLAG